MSQLLSSISENQQDLLSNSFGEQVSDSAGGSGGMTRTHSNPSLPMMTEENFRLESTTGDLIFPEKAPQEERLSLSTLLQSSTPNQTREDVSFPETMGSFYPEMKQGMRKRSISHPNLPEMGLMTTFLDEDLMQLLPDTSDPNLESESQSAVHNTYEWYEEPGVDPGILWSDIYAKESIQTESTHGADTLKQSTLHSTTIPSIGKESLSLPQSGELAAYSRYIREQIAQFDSMREKEKHETREQLDLIAKLLKLQRTRTKIKSKDIKRVDLRTNRFREE